MKKIIYLLKLSTTSLFGQTGVGNLIAHYSFDGNCNVETTYEDINNGIPFGNPEYVPGINGEPNSAIKIKNDSENITYVDLGNNNTYGFNKTSSFSISLWVKTIDNVGFGCILVKGNSDPDQWDYGVKIEDGIPYTGTHSVDLKSNETIDNGQWEHLVVTYSDGDYKLFVNNVNFYILLSFLFDR